MFSRSIQMLNSRWKLISRTFWWRIITNSNQIKIWKNSQLNFKSCLINSQNFNTLNKNFMGETKLSIRAIGSKNTNFSVLRWRITTNSNRIKIWKNSRFNFKCYLINSQNFNTFNKYFLGETKLSSGTIGSKNTNFPVLWWRITPNSNPIKIRKKIPFEIWSTLEQIHKVSMGSKNIFCFKQSSKLGATRHRTKQFKRKKGITTYQTYLKRIIMKKKMKIIEKGSYEYAMK